MEFLNFNRVELLPNAKASAAFSADSGLPDLVLFGFGGRR